MKHFVMERNKNQNITVAADPGKRSSGSRTAGGKRKEHSQKTGSTPATAQEIDHETERHPKGEPSYPVTNEAEQRKITNAEIDGAMGEKETEGV